MGFFADKISQDHHSWFTNLIKQQEYEEALIKKGNHFSRAQAIYERNAQTFRALTLWLITMGMMISYSMLEVGWSFSGKLYMFMLCNLLL